jgi:SAM-dependent methyltransferase
MTITNPDSSAKELWMKASSDWKSRTQDNNYRTVLVHPAITTEISDVLENKGLFIDLGCGDGNETQFMRYKLIPKGFNRFYGFDTNKEFIDTARKLYKGITFDHGDFSELKLKYELQGKADLIVSQFVLQDTPYIKGLLSEVYDSLKPHKPFISVIVNPQFAERLLAKNEIKLNDVEGDPSKDFIFMGEYPITEPGRPPFYVPYFHRNLSDYIRLLEKNFHIETICGLKPSRGFLKTAKKEKVTPFYEEQFNVYWPEISETPASFLIKCVKK